jgi:hypothetical protein
MCIPPEKIVLSSDFLPKDLFIVTLNTCLV